MKKRFLLIVLALAFFVIGLFAVNTYYRLYCLDGFCDDSIDMHSIEKLLEYDGGDEALSFFPEMDDLNDAQNIDILYQDNRAKTTFLHTFYSFFMLDIMYQPDQYLAKKEQISDQSLVVSNEGFTLLTEDNTSNSICKAVYCCDEDYVIRYILFYGDIKKNVSVEALIVWNASEFFD